MKFDPSGVGVKGSLFGIPVDPQRAQVVIIPVPWNVTASYGKASIAGPQAILEASCQLDLSLPGIRTPWVLGMTMIPISIDWEGQCLKLVDRLAPYLTLLEQGSDVSEHLQLVHDVNKAGEGLNVEVENLSIHHLNKGKMVGVVGGDHSVSLGLVQALAQQYPSFGILHIDAHADLRKAYQGFDHSHASIMHNMLEIDQVSHLVQVGIRDYCPEEEQRMKQDPRITPHYDAWIKAKLFEGVQWNQICDRIAGDLPEMIYISFDIDGLDPKLCPSTGTPVPGGLDFEQADYLLKVLVMRGKKIIGFDLCEVGVGDDAWDGNVGARILYRLGAYSGVSRGILQADFTA